MSIFPRSTIPIFNTFGYHEVNKGKLFLNYTATVKRTSLLGVIKSTLK